MSFFLVPIVFAIDVALNQQHDLIVHYHPCPTHFPHNGNLPSTIDIFITKGITNTCFVDVDDTLLSDHALVMCIMDLLETRLPSPSQEFISGFSRANWSGF